MTLGAGEIATFNSGAGGDLQISGDATGSFSLIKQTGGGDLIIQGQNGHLRNDANGSLIAWDNAKAELYWRGNGAGARLATTEAGINVTGKVECKDTVAITTTGSGTDPSPDLDFINLHADAIGERLGQINYYGMNDESGSGSGQTKYAWTEVRTIDVTEDSEKAQHETWVKNGASHSRVLQVQPTGIDVTGTIECDTSLQIQSSGSSADAMPDLYMTNVETAADAQNLGMISFRGYNDAATPTIEGYANIYAQQVDVSDGAEKGKLVLQARNGAGYVEALEVNKDGIDVTGTVTCDGIISGANSFEITNNLATSIVSSAGKTRFNVTDSSAALFYGATAADVGAVRLVTTATGIDLTGATAVNGTLSVNSTSADTTYSPEIVLERNGGAAAGDDGDKLGVITFKGDNTSGVQSVYAQIGARIVDDGADNTTTKGEIRIACGYNATANLEDPSLRIDHRGTWINESLVDGAPANTSFYNVAQGVTSGIKYWAGQSSGYAIEVRSATPTADRDIKFPDVSGFVVVSGVAGGSMNGGGGLGTAQTAWSPAQFMANANTDYYHYTASGTDVDLLVAVPFSGIDLNEYGAKYTFRNISADSGSKITIDLDGFTSASSQGATQYYAINKYDGSTPSLITSASANLVISAGGVIEMSPIAAGVWNVTGTGFA